MELDENTSPYSSEEIENFHKIAQDSGAVFTTKSFVVSQIVVRKNNIYSNQCFLC